METKRAEKIVVCLAIILLGPAASLRGAVWYVDAGAPAGGDGTTWATAFRDLQSAVNAADPRWIECMAPYDRIYVKSGIYAPPSTININKVVDIYGGYPNTVANPAPAQRNWKTYQTIITGGDLRRCFYITRICELNGFYIQSGYHASTIGSAVYVDNVDPADCLSGWLTARLRNCWIRYNTGTAVYDARSDLTIQDCIFSDNTAPAGGAIYHLYSSPLIERCKFYGNASTALGSIGGGAIAGFYGNAATGQVTRINNCLFFENTSANYGGAISYNQGYPRIKNCTFAGNTAADDYHLQSTSPCIDTASNGYGIVNDLDGNGTAVCDMGAYEYSFVDLVITAIETRPYKPAPFQAVDIDITVVNQGTKDAAQHFFVDWYANQDFPPETGDVGDAWYEVPSLAAGNSVVVTLSSWDYESPGAYAMYAQVDTDEDVAESNETNNIFGPQTIHVNTCRADINEDNHVDMEDIARMAKAWLSSEGGPGWDRQCDLTEPGDGQIGIPDMAVLADDWLCKEP